MALFILILSRKLDPLFANFVFVLFEFPHFSIEFSVCLFRLWVFFLNVMEFLVIVFEVVFHSLQIHFVFLNQVFKLVLATVRLLQSLFKLQHLLLQKKCLTLLINRTSWLVLGLDHTLKIRIYFILLLKQLLKSSAFLHPLVPICFRSISFFKWGFVVRKNSFNGRSKLLKIWVFLSAFLTVYLVISLKINVILTLQERVIWWMNLITNLQIT